MCFPILGLGGDQFRSVLSETELVSPLVNLAERKKLFLIKSLICWMGYWFYFSQCKIEANTPLLALRFPFTSQLCTDS